MARKRAWTLIHSENVTPLKMGGYESRQLTGNEIAGFPVINVNEGALAPGCRTEGGSHNDTELYYILSGSGDVWIGEDRIPAKLGDVLVIPPNAVHWIDNTRGEAPFVLLTLWPKQEQNGVYHARMEAWGTSYIPVDPAYTEKRLGEA